LMLSSVPYAGPALGATYWASRSAGNISDELRKAGLDSGDALQKAIPMGIVIGALNKAGADGILNKGTVCRLASRVAERGVSGKVAIAAVRGFLAESSAEGAQTGFENITKDIIKLRNSGATEDEIWEFLVNKAPEYAQDMAYSSLVGGTMGVGAGVAVGKMRGDFRKDTPILAQKRAQTPKQILKQK